MVSTGSPRCPRRSAWRPTSSAPAPGRSSLAGSSSAIRSAPPWRRMAVASCASGWAPTTWRLSPPDCWPWAQPSSSSLSTRGAGPYAWPPPIRRRPQARQGLWPRRAHLRGHAERSILLNAWGGCVSIDTRDGAQHTRALKGMRYGTASYRWMGNRLGPPPPDDDRPHAHAGVGVSAGWHHRLSQPTLARLYGPRHGPG